MALIEMVPVLIIGACARLDGALDTIAELVNDGALSAILQ